LPPQADLRGNPAFLKASRRFVPRAKEPLVLKGRNSTWTLFFMPFPHH
jgi:hypothetical protein